MGYEPQRVVGPDGTEMVMLTAAAYEQMIDDLDDARDILESEKSLARIAAGEGTMPGAVLSAIHDEQMMPVAAWRRYRGWTQTELAARAGLSQVFISRIESGAAHGSPATRRKLAKALDAPVWTLELEEDQ